MGKKTSHPELVNDEDDPIVTMADLPQFGIRYHPTHLRRLWKAGKFPKPFKLSANRLGWRRSWIRQHLAERERGE